MTDLRGGPRLPSNSPSRGLKPLLLGGGDLREGCGHFFEDPELGCAKEGGGFHSWGVPGVPGRGRLEHGDGVKQNAVCHRDAGLFGALGGTEPGRRGLVGSLILLVKWGGLVSAHAHSIGSFSPHDMWPRELAWGWCVCPNGSGVGNGGVFGWELVGRTPMGRSLAGWLCLD